MVSLCNGVSSCGVVVTQKLVTYFNLICILEKKTGYVEHGLGEGVVLYLTNSIQQLGCEVYIDNFFNSPQLQFTLLQQGIYSCGTVRPNKKKTSQKR